MPKKWYINIYAIISDLIITKRVLNEFIGKVKMSFKFSI
jgi:hypothetical protein